MANVSNSARRLSRRLSLFAAFTAGEAYSIYATFFAHAFGPSAVYVVDRPTSPRVALRQVGHIEVVFNWASVIHILVVSLIIFGLVWFATWATGKYATDSRRKPSLGLETS